MFANRLFCFAAFLLVLTAPALFSGTGGNAEAEAQALQMVKDLRGIVERDPKQVGNPVVHVYLAGDRLTDGDLGALDAFASLKYITITFDDVTVAGLKRLRKIKQSLRLDLARCESATDETLLLEGLGQLSWLDLTHTKATDKCLKTLRGLQHIEVLRLGHTAITDDGLKHLGQLQRLRELELWETKVTDAGLKELVVLKKLGHIDVGWCKKVTDVGVKVLTELPDVQWLNLIATDVTDSSLQELARCKQLRTLLLTDTKVTPEGVQRLRKVLPNCNILPPY